MQGGAIHPNGSSCILYTAVVHRSLHTAHCTLHTAHFTPQQQSAARTLASGVRWWRAPCSTDGESHHCSGAAHRRAAPNPVCRAERAPRPARPACREITRLHGSSLHNCIVLYYICPNIPLTATQLTLCIYWCAAADFDNFTGVWPGRVER